MRISGSPPVRRILLTPSRATILDNACDLFKRQQFIFLHPYHAFFRHAIVASEIAAVGDRNAHVVDRAPEGIFQLVGWSQGVTKKLFLLVFRSDEGLINFSVLEVVYAEFKPYFLQLARNNCSMECAISPVPFIRVEKLESFIFPFLTSMIRFIILSDLCGKFALQPIDKKFFH